MLDILDTVRAWRKARLAVAIATLVEVRGSSPRLAGSSIAVNERGDVAGSLSGGCIETDVYEAAQAALAGAPPVVLDFHIASDDDELETGLTCGGELRVAVRRLAEEDDVALQALEEALHENSNAKLILAISNDANGGLTLVDGLAVREPSGFGKSQGVAEWPAAHASLRRSPTGTEFFVIDIVPKPDLYIFGALDFSRAMAAMGRFVGFRVTVIDPRPIFATAARIPEADRIVVAWPDEFLSAASVDESTSVVVLTHDEKFDLPLLRIALAGDAGYIGVLGSRRTHARRIAALRREGIAETSLARLHAPVGLDIGACTPEETALAIAAEIIAARNGRLGGMLRGGRSSLRGPVSESGRALMSV